MADRQFTDEAALYQEQEDLPLAEDIVHALDASVAQSVNRALVVVLQPLARQLKGYALTVPPNGQPTPGLSTHQTDAQVPRPTTWPHAAPLARLSQTMVTDHKYSAQPSTSTQGLPPPPPDTQSDDPHSPHTDSDDDSPQPKRRQRSPGGPFPSFEARSLFLLLTSILRQLCTLDPPTGHPSQRSQTMYRHD
ncbi:hypothetical protein NDU88_001424 [Pleurodeles waltl]|uniref:Uncharacterized protein n=1 Tax=Pleurodeles waltl TaxID=8319 RepID=A0AAV7SZK3_PLEWA|nr:hypothetical protein NDU88_001424 [Pleurodeles waltl]